MPETKAAPNQNQPNFDVLVWDDKAKDYKPVYTAPDATNAVKGDVLLSDATNSISDAATGMTAATPKAVKAVADAANNKLDKTITTAQTVAGPVLFTQKITGSVSGSAATLETARSIAIKNGTAAAGSANFNGSANITINLAQLDASTLATGTVPVNRLPADAITKVKGNNETTYRVGNVNLTPENIGALKITKDSQSYYHAAVPSDGQEGYLCMPTSGILPANSSTDGIGHIGTQSWPFREAFIKNVHGTSDYVRYGHDPNFVVPRSRSTRTIFDFASYRGGNFTTGTDDVGGTFLLENYAAFGAVATGLCVIQIQVRAGVARMVVNEIAPVGEISILNDTITPDFGFYKDASTFRFAAILPAYHGAKILPLEVRNMTLKLTGFTSSNTRPSGFSRAEYNKLGQSAVFSSAQPRGDNSVIWIKS